MNYKALQLFQRGYSQTLPGKHTKNIYKFTKTGLTTEKQLLERC